MRAEEVRVLYRDEQGFTQVVRACDIQGINEFMRTGAALGYLWMEGHFGCSDVSLTKAPQTPQRKGGLML